MKTQISNLAKQLADVCIASKLDQKSALTALLDCYEAIGLKPVDPQDLPAILPDYDFDGLVIELERMVATRNGVVVKFTLKEWKILTALIKSNGRPLSKARLISMIYDDLEPSSNTVDVFLSHLRVKLGRGVINTMRGIGYVLASKAVLK